MEYNQRKIGDCCEITSSKRVFYSEYTKSGVPFYRSKEIVQLFLGQNIDDSLYISQEKYSRMHEKFGVPNASDILLTSVGTIGIPYFIKDTDYFYFKDGNLTWFRNFNNNLYSKYLYYWIQSPQGKGIIYNSAIGSSQKALTISNLKEITLPLPSLNNQKKIAKILSNYEDLIKNNQNKIRLLEEAASRLYNEWFINLRFPGYEKRNVVNGLPEGWKYGKLSECIEVNSRSVSKKYNYQEIQYVDISSVNHGRIEKYSKYKLNEAPGRAKRIAIDGDTIWGMVRPNLKAFALVLTPEENFVFSTGFSVLSPKNIPYTFLYCFVTQDAFVGYLVNCTNGSAYPAVKPVHFEEAKLIIPDKDMLDKFHNLTDPMFRIIRVIETQNLYLRNTFDRLLPKLLTGEMEV